MRLTVPSPEGWHCCLVGRYDCLLINIKVASNHVPTTNALPPFACWRFPISKGASESAASWRPQQQDKEQPRSPTTFFSALAGMWLCKYTHMILAKPEKPPKSLAVCGHYTLSKIPSQFQAWELIQPYAYVPHCTHHLRYWYYQSLSYHFFHLILNTWVNKINQ